MIRPGDELPRDAHEWAEGPLFSEPLFRSRRGAEALPKLAPAERSNAFEQTTFWAGVRAGALAVLALVGLIVSIIGLVLVWGLR